MDLAELGIVYVSEGADAAIAKSEEYRDAVTAIIQTEEERVKAAGKVASATEALSAQITRSIISYQGAQSAQYEFASIAMGVNDQLSAQIELLKTLEQMDRLATQTAKDLSQEARNEQGALLDLAKDIQYLNKVRAQEAAEAEAGRQKELASRNAYYNEIISKAKAAEQAISDARHKAIYDQMDATAKAAAMYTKDEQERVKAVEKGEAQIAAANQKATASATKEAEVRALSEISWAKKSRDEQLRVKAEIAAYQGAGVSPATITNTFGSAAVSGTVKEVNTLAEKWSQVTLNTSRARTEMVVLAHEAIQGRFSRIPASMMVFAEYSDLTAFALSGVGLAIMGVVAAGVLMSVGMVKGTLEQEAMQNALINTGNYAGTTADRLNAMGHSAVQSGGSLSEAKRIVTELAASGKYTAEQIGTVSVAIVAMGHATGMSEKEMDGLVKQFASLQVQAGEHARYSDNISKALLKLDDQYHFLTTSVLMHVHALEQEGKQKEASKLATDEFAKATKDRAEEIISNLGRVERGWNAIKEAVGNAKSAVGDWGKKSTAESRVLALQGNIAIENANLSSLSPDNMSGKDYENKIRWTKQLAEDTAALEVANKELFRVNEQAAAQGAQAQAQSKANHALQLMEADSVKLKADRVGELTIKIEQANQRLADIKADPTATAEVISRAEIMTQENILALRKKYAEARAKGTDDRAKLLADALIVEKTALDGEKQIYDDRMKMLETYHKKLGLSDTDYYSGREATREEYLKALTASYNKEAKLINDSVTKTPVEDANKQKQLDALYKEYSKTWDKIAELRSVDSVQQIADIEKVYDASVKAIDNSGKKEFAALEKSIAAQKLHNAEIGKTPAQIEMVKAALNDQKIVQQENELAALEYFLTRKEGDEDFLAVDPLITKAYTERVNWLKKLLAAEKELKIEHEKGSVLDENDATQKKINKEWEKGWKETDRLAREVFNTWAIEGGNAAEKIGKTLKSALVNAIYDATVKKIVFQIYASVMGGAASGAASATTSGMVSSGVGYVGGATGATAFSTGFSSMAGETAIGSSFVGPSVASAGGATGAGAGLYSTMSAIPVYGWIALAVVAAYAIFHKEWISATSLGSAGARYDATGNQIQVTNATEMPGQAAALATVNALGSTYITLAKQLGVNPGDTTFQYQSNTGRESQNPNFTMQALRDGTNQLYNTTTDNASLFAPHEVALDEAHLRIETSRVILSALQSAELPKAIKGVFDGLVPASMNQEQLDAALTAAQSFANLHNELQALPFPYLKDISYAAAKGLVAAAGGMEALGSSLGTYYDKFYSAEEKRAQTIKNLNASVSGAGVTGFDAATTTRDQYRAMVELAGAQDLSIVANAKAYAGLLSIAGAFDQITPAAEAAKATVDTLKEAMKKLTADSENLAVELLRAKGDNRGADFLAMGIDPNDSKNAEAVSAYNANEATRALIKTYTDATQAAEELAAATKSITDSLNANSKSLQDEFDILTKVKTERQVATAGYTTEQVAIYDHNVALRASIDAFNAHKQVLETNKGLEDQRDILLGTQTERSIDLRNATDETTKALMREIYSAQDAADAANKLAAATKKAADEQYALQTKLLTLQGNTTALRARELALLDPSNRALQRQIWALEDAKAAQDAYNNAISEAKGKVDAATQAVQAANDKITGIRESATNAYIASQDKVAAATKAVADVNYEAANKMLQIGKSLRDFVNADSNKLSFASVLGKALRGDQEAMQALPDAANYEIDRSRNMSRTALEAASAKARVMSNVASVAALAEATPIEARDTPMVAAQKALIAAQQEQTSALRVANTIGAATSKSAEDLIAKYNAAVEELAKATVDLAAANAVLLAIKLNTAATVVAVTTLANNIKTTLLNTDSTINFIVGSQLPQDLKDLATTAVRTIAATVNFLVGSTLPDTLQQMVLDTENNILYTINLVAGTDLPPDFKKIALGDTSTLTKLVDLAVRDNTLTADQLTIVLSTASTLTKTIDMIAGSALSADLKLLALTANSTLTKTLDYVVGSELPAQLFTLAVSTVGLMTKTIDFLVGSTLSADLKKLALADVSTLTKTLDFVVGSALANDIKTIAITSVSTLTKTIDMIAASTIPTDLKTLALGLTSTLTKSIDFVIGSALPADVQTIALASATTLTKTVDLIVASTVSNDLKTLALSTTSTLTRTLDIVAGSSLSGTLMAQAFNAGTAISRTIELVAGSTMTDALKAQAFGAATDISRTIGLVAGSTMTTDLVAKAFGTATAIDRAIGLIAGGTMTDTLKAQAFNVGTAISRSVELTVGSTLTGTLKAQAFDAASAITRSVGLVADSTLSGTLKAQAFDVGTDLTRTVNLAAGTNSLDADSRALALAQTGSISRTISTIASNNWLSASDAALALAATATVTRTFKAALGTSDADAIAIANAEADTVTRTIAASGGALTVDQRTILEAAVGGSTSVAVIAGGTIEWTATDEINMWLKGIFNATAGLWNAAGRGGDTGLLVKFDHGTIDGQPGGNVFASGGAFTNGIVSRPTSFNMGLMGEGGNSEAIMPLANIGGSLGVRASGANNARLESLVQALTQEVINLRAEARATAINTNKMAKILRNITQDGTSMTVTTNSDSPLQVEPVL